MKEKCCGNCRHFDYEDIDGYGWCCKQSANADCEGLCSMYEYNYNGWTEITPDNLEDVRKLPIDKLMIAVIHRRKSFYVRYPDMLCLLSEMANLGGYYYYVLPELKIE